MRALVTGAGGFCGRHLVAYLRCQGVDVHTVGGAPARAGDHSHLVDPTDVATLCEVVRTVEPDYVFHLAGVTCGDDPTVFFTINASYGAALLQALATAGLADRPTLLVGTAAEYGLIASADLPIVETHRPRPYNLYGISKLAQTHVGQMLAGEGRPIVIARPFNIVGAGMPEHLVVGTLARQVARVAVGLAPPILRVGRLDTARDFVDVTDAVAIYWDLVRTPAAYGEIVNVCSGRPTTVEAVVMELVARVGREITIEIDPKRLRGVDIAVHFGSVEKLHGLVGYAPATPLEASLASVLDEMVSACARL